jgi:hypothetical protein
MHVVCTKYVDSFLSPKSSATNTPSIILCLLIHGLELNGREIESRQGIGSFQKYFATYLITDRPKTTIGNL